jgi:hypothetical protein
MRLVLMNLFNVCIASLLVGGIPNPLLAQANAKSNEIPLPNSTGSEQGNFKIFFGGELIGEERFQIGAEATNYKAWAEIHLTLDRGNDKVTFNIKPSLQFTKFFEPLTYKVLQEAGDNRMKASIHFKPESSQAVYETGQETDSREIKLSGDVVVLDDNVFHHYVLLARRYDYSKGGVQEFSAFVPQQFLAGNISVADQGFESVQLGTKTLSLQHLLVDTGEIQINLWLNTHHELQKISVPKSHVDVLRD